MELNSYRIMNRYLVNYVEEGDDSMKTHCEELLRICDYILEGCTDEKQCLETIGRKAKIVRVILRMQEKKLIVAGKLMEAAKKDGVLSELLLRTYKTDDILQWTKNWLRTAPQEPLVKLRENWRFREMLDGV